MNPGVYLNLLLPMDPPDRDAPTIFLITDVGDLQAYFAIETMTACAKTHEECRLLGWRAEQKGRTFGHYWEVAHSFPTLPPEDWVSLRVDDGIFDDIQPTIPQWHYGD